MADPNQNGNISQMVALNQSPNFPRQLQCITTVDGITVSYWFPDSFTMCDFMSDFQGMKHHMAYIYNEETPVECRCDHCMIFLKTVDDFYGKWGLLLDDIKTVANDAQMNLGLPVLPYP